MKKILANVLGYGKIGVVCILYVTKKTLYRESALEIYV